MHIRLQLRLMEYRDKFSWHFRSKQSEKVLTRRNISCRNAGLMHVCSREGSHFCRGSTERERKQSARKNLEMSKKRAWSRGVCDVNCMLYLAARIPYWDTRVTSVRGLELANDNPGADSEEQRGEWGKAFVLENIINATGTCASWHTAREKITSDNLLAYTYTCKCLIVWHLCETWGSLQTYLPNSRNLFVMFRNRNDLEISSHEKSGHAARMQQLSEILPKL